MSKEYPWGKGTPKWARDATLNDSDKSFTVPAGKIWVLKRVYAQLVCTATVGNRLLQATFTNGTDIVFMSPKTGNITASQTGVLVFGYDIYGSATAVQYAPKLDTTSPNVIAAFSTGELVLPAGYVMRVYDSAAVDAAADDLTVLYEYVEYDA